MTLNPVFRSEKALEFLRGQGYLEKFQPALEIQKKARDEIYDLIINHHNSKYYGDYKEKDDKAIFEKDFFLILFNSLLLYAESELVEWYAKFNYCIRGEITSADNIFDSHEENAKTTLPFNDNNLKGKFRSIAELKTYGHLFHELSKEIQNYGEIKSKLDNIMLSIGMLEGSEEQGIDRILEPGKMIRQVHRIRGGLLFELGMIAPPILEPGKISYWETIHNALGDIGTAFQIIDDITDFEFDLKRKSHNIVSAEIYHNGTPKEKSHFQYISQNPDETNLIEKYFRGSTREVLRRAYGIAEDGFKKLKEIDFWYRPHHSIEFVNAIAGDQGTERLEKVLST